MKAEELRIGNFVLELGKPEVVGKRTFENWDTFNLEDHLHPIPLTEEWLLRLGFRKFGKDFSLKGVIVHKRKRGYVIRKSTPIMNSVHVIQNYFYAVTGEELKFKL